MTFILFRELLIMHVRCWAWMSILIYNDKIIYCAKFRPIVTPVISYSIANFLMQCLGMPSERFLAWTRKHSPTFLRQVLDVYCVPRVPWRSTRKMMCCFLNYCHERPSDFNHGVQSFGRSFWLGNIYRYGLSTKFLIWSNNAIEVVLVFSETRF